MERVPFPTSSTSIRTPVSAAPLLAGAFHRSRAELLPRVTTISPCGAAGASASVSNAAAAPGGPSPTAFIATTRSEYVRPGASPAVISHERSGPAHALANPPAASAPSPSSTR
jgi:hypothetical protein